MVGVIEALAQGPAARAAMATRADLIAASEANGRAALRPADPGGLPIPLRLALASRIATLNGDARTAAHYRAELAPGDGAPAEPAWLAPEDARLAAILRHVDLVTRAPREATREDIAALRAAGLAEADIVRLAQLVAFVNYQLRVVAGLRLLEADA